MRNILLPSALANYSGIQKNLKCLDFPMAFMGIAQVLEIIKVWPSTIDQLPWNLSIFGTGTELVVYLSCVWQHKYL